MGVMGLRDLFLVAPASTFQHHHHHHHHDQVLADQANAVIPLLATSPWQNQSALQHAHGAAAAAAGGLFKRQEESSDGGSSRGLWGGATCQDCGNQAKKDCGHRRCRTCCKSRGFDCATHVKSTWVPAARRRERQQMSAGAAAAIKRPRTLAESGTGSHTSTSNTTPPGSFDSGSSHQDASFRESLPAQVRAPALFKCVRVTSIDDGEAQYAYQAAVKIGGHVFKGFLYDRGVEDRDGLPNISDLHLGGSNGMNVSSSSLPALDPSDVYNNSGGSGGLLGGTAFGN